MQWNFFDRIINIIWIFIWISVGTFTLYMHNNLLPYIFIIFAIGTIMAHTYLYCTRCKHYGENCYIFGGMISQNWFKKREMSSLDPDDSICASLWIILAIFPAPFLLYYQDWFLLAVYLFSAIGWFLQHRQTACPKCENTWCSLNPNKKE